MTGLYALNRTWNWWWENSISSDALVWLPTDIGYTGSIALTLVGLGAAYVVVLWWEKRGGFVLPPIAKRPEVPPATVGDEIRRVLGRVFRAEWSPIVGGVALGALNILLFLRYRPLGLVGEISRWSTDVADKVGAAPGVLQGVDGLAGCTAAVAAGGSWFTEAFTLNTGIVVGSFAAATMAGEFRLRVPRNPTRYAQALGGGVVMGYGAGLAVGCTIGAFFSAIPSLALNGWVFAIALAAGACGGVMAIRRLS